MDVFGLYSLSYGKFFFDPIYTALCRLAAVGVARLAGYWFDRYVIDGLVDLVRQAARCWSARLAAAAERAWSSSTPWR